MFSDKLIFVSTKCARERYKKMIFFFLKSRLRKEDHWESGLLSEFQLALVWVAK